MDTTQLTTLAACLAAEPDPRCARGIRHPWGTTLTILAGGLLCGQRTVRAIAQWARAHRALLARYLPLWRGQVPSEKTLQRALGRLDLAAFEARIDAFIAGTRTPVAHEALALDGKALRGASKGRPKVHLLTLAAHADGAVLGRRNVGAKTNELAVAPLLFAGRELGGRTVTGDAMFCHRALCAQVQAHGGHWLWQVKDNQPTLLADLIALFGGARGGPHPLTFWAADACGGGHGRVEVRRLEASADLNEYLDWPGLAQVVWRRCERWVGGQASAEDHYYITSLPHAAASPDDLLDLCQGHWQIENNVNRARDVVFGEDASTLPTGTAPEAMSVLRDAVCHLLHQRAGFLLSDKLRFFQHHPAHALRALGLSRL